MILLSSILFAFLLVLVVMVTRIQSVFQGNKTNQVEEYENVEWKVLNASIDYYGEKIFDKDSVRVTTSTLVKEGYLDSSSLNVNQDTCSGYVKFTDSEPSVFIRCKNYKTSGYKE